MDLVVDKTYRLSPILREPKLRGKVATFKGYLDRSFDIRRAVMRPIEPDGSLGEEWLVNPHYVISL